MARWGGGGADLCSRCGPWFGGRGGWVGTVGRRANKRLASVDIERVARATVLGGAEAPPFAAGQETDDGLSAVLIGAADAPSGDDFFATIGGGK